MGIRKNGLLFCCSLLALLTVMNVSLKADDIRVTMTVDNSFALYYGTQTAATNWVGSDNDWTTAETYDFSLGSDKYLYIVTASDIAVAQGFLGQFENLTTGYKFYSQDVQWQVMATGLRDGSLSNYGAPYTGSPDDLALLTNEINDANGGGNPSHGWVATTPGPLNGSAPWGNFTEIDPEARWVWYGTDDDGDPTTPGQNNDEWLVFRISFGATPVPVPSGIILVGIGGMAIGCYQWRRRRVASRKPALVVA